MLPIELAKALAMNAQGHDVELPEVSSWRVRTHGTEQARLVVVLESGEMFDLVVIASERPDH